MSRWTSSRSMLRAIGCLPSAASTLAGCGASGAAARCCLLSPSGASRRTCVLYGPVERVVGDGLPSGRAAGPVVPALELEVLGERGRVVVVPGIGPVDRGRHDVVLLAADEQQRSTVLVVVDPCLLVARL